MPEQYIVTGAWRRERWIVMAIAIALTLARSTIFVAWPTSYFDSDQAVFGLMAKHIAELRAFPVFMYGQAYMLAVEAWMTAPLFAVFGASAITLKMPLLVMNAGITWMLLRTLERETGLRPIAAGAASLPFILPAAAMGAVYVEASGGTLEPYLYVLLMWTLRERPLAAGLVFGIGFMNREFTIYGLAALLVIDAMDRRLFTKAGLLARASMLGVSAIVWITVQGLFRFSSGSGPGTSIDQIYGASNNVLELAGRTCFSPATVAPGIGRLFSLHWPALLGTAPYPLSAFAIESSVHQGLAGSSWLPAAFVAICLAGGTPVAIKARFMFPRFPAYLMLVGLFSAAGYVLGRCGQVNFVGMRYDLLSVLGLVGLAGWFLHSRPAKPLLAVWAVVLAAWLVVLAVPHVRLAREYGIAPPVPAKVQLIDALEARGIRYGWSDYWIAYYVSFLTNERIVLASEDFQRLLTYRRLVEQHAGEAVRISRRPCAGGVLLIHGVYQCPR
jgi:hypothetical protein